MNKHKFLCALAVTMIVGASCCCVPMYAQPRMSLQSLFAMADQQSQHIKVSEEALKAAEEGVSSAKSALLPSVELSVQGSYTGNAFLMSRGFSTRGATEYIVPGLGPQNVQNGKQPTPHWGNSFTAQVSQVIYAGGAIRSGIEMSKLGCQMAELDVEKNRQEVRFLLTGYYLDLYKLQNQSQVIAKNIELTERVIEQMKVRREQGTVLKKRNTLNVLNVKRNDTSAPSTGKKDITIEGKAIMTNVPSNLFHPSDQYPLKPSCICFNTISMMKKILKSISRISSILLLTPHS
ncbi:MAG: TolC family protein [Bacteroidales bacterium]|nr:TolC family protein [Bacteroidales bacterium]